MTVIAACTDVDGTVWMGGDAVTLEGGGCVRMDKRSKVFRVGQFLVGSSGIHRACQIVQYTFTPPPVSGDDLTCYMVREFVPALRSCMALHSGEYKENDQTLMNGRSLVGLNGRLFEIDSSYGVFCPKSTFHSIGCAAQEAMAGMFIAHDFLKSGEEIVLRGLLAAAEFDINIRPPFTILSLPSARENG